MSQTNFLQSSSTSKTFKIRKTRAKLLQQIQDRQQVANLNEVDFNKEKNNKDRTLQPQQQPNQIQPKQYIQDQEDLNCYRFPHSSFCGCQSNCLLESFDPIQIMPNLYYGNFVTGLKTKNLLEIGVTHILNVTSKQYTKREQYFEYLNIDLHYNTEEDAKKFFRLSNRFIKGAVRQGGKVFIHSSVMQLGVVMALGYLIGVEKVPFKQSLNFVIKNGLQISPHFFKQIQSYDLEKMAFVSIQRE